LQLPASLADGSIRPVLDGRLQRARPHRSPRSFPTRRSSDLSTGTSSATASDLSRDSLGSRLPFSRRESWLAARSTRLPSSERVRSEEHTSELQSRENLVCRLLLEKKKQTKILKHDPRSAEPV